MRTKAVPDPLYLFPCPDGVARLAARLEQEHFASRNPLKRRVREVRDFRVRSDHSQVSDGLNALRMFDQRWDATGVPVPPEATPRTGRPSLLGEEMSLAVMHSSPANWCGLCTSMVSEHCKRRIWNAASAHDQGRGRNGWCQALATLRDIAKQNAATPTQNAMVRNPVSAETMWQAPSGNASAG